MSDDELLHALRNSKGWPTLGNAAANRIEELEAKLAKVKEAFLINMMDALPDYTHEMFDRDYAKIVGETDA